MYPAFFFMSLRLSLISRLYLSFPLKDVREPEVELEDRRHEKTAGLAMRTSRENPDGLRTGKSPFYSWVNPL